MGIATTRQACEKFKLRPTTIVNFVEGSRFTQSKQISNNSPLRHLLPAKAAGLTLTLNVLGKQFDRILNVTLLYPDNEQTPFLDMLCGNMGRVIIRVEMLPIEGCIRGDYLNDKAFKRQFQLWLNRL